MKKYLDIIVTLFIVGLLCLFFVSSPLFWTKYEVHQPAFIYVSQNVVEFDDNFYSYYYTLKNETFVRETKYDVGKMTANNEYLFVEVDKSIYMIDKNYDVKYIFKCDTTLDSIAVSDSNLYCYLGGTANPKLYIFDLITKEETILNVSYNSLYEIDGDSVLVHGYDTIYVVNDVVNEFKGTSYANDRIIFYKNRMINFTSSPSLEVITIDYLNEQISIEVGFNCFLGSIKCYDDDIYFEVVNKIQPDDCMTMGGLCICNLNKTNVYKYNIKTKEITTFFNLKEEEFLIDFTNEYVVYYSDGKVYKNNEIIKSVTPIKVGNIIEIKGDKTYKSGTEISSSRFAYFNNKLYYSYENNLNFNL